MASKIAVMGDEDTVVGFKFGGIKDGYIITNKEEAKKTFENLIKEKDIIIITENIADKLRSEINKISEEPLPIIIEIPDKTGPSKKTVDPMRELVKKSNWG